MRIRLPSLALTLACLVPACAEPTALDLLLTADPNVTDTASLVQQLRGLRLVLDSTEGLYASPPTATDPAQRLEDLDGDGQLELISEHAVEGLDRLPRIRLERGGLPSGSLDLRLDGAETRPGERPEPERVYFAAGGVRGVRFGEDGVRELEVPFNRRLLYRLPQVTQVNPEDGATEEAGNFDSVVVIFSKKMNPDSLRQQGVLRVVRVEAGRETELPPLRITVTNLGGLESPAMAEYLLPSVLELGSYRVLVSSAARDISGRPLDQVPMQPGEQSFSSSFTVVPSQTPTPACAPLCGGLCSQGGDRCAAGLACDPATRTCHPAHCPASCPAGDVCDPDRGLCLPDCRVHGSYGGCAEGALCQPSGLCSP